MRAMKVQKGLTLMGFIIVLAVVGFFAFIGMKLFPIYSEYYAVVSAVKGIQAEPGVATMPPAQIMKLLDRRFYTSYVTTVKPNNISVKREQGGYILRVAYERREPLMYNLDIIAKFEKVANLAGGRAAVD